LSEVNSMMGVRMRICTRTEAQYKELVSKIYSLYPTVSWSAPKLNDEHEFVGYINFRGSPHYHENYAVFPQYNSSASK